MIGCKVWGLTGNSHNFALFRRIPRTKPSSRPSHARIGGEPAKVHINQSAFVVYREGISSDHRIWKRCGIRSLRSYQHPVGSKAGSGQVYPRRNQVMTIPTRRGNLASFRIRWINWRRAYVRRHTCDGRGRDRVRKDAAPDQIWNRCVIA